MTRYSPLAMSAFELFFLPWRRRRLEPPVFVGLPQSLAEDRPLVLVANHTSWWDGFLLRDIHRALRPRSPFFTVMKAAELARLPYFRHIGAIPVDAADPRSVLRMVRFAARRCRERQDTTIAFFPQGEIWPAWRRPLGFRRGIDVLLRAIGPAWVVPVGLHVESLSRAAPTAFVVAAPAIRWPEQDAGAEYLERCVTESLDIIMRLLNERGERAVTYLRNRQ